jgi:hypothetical protein
MFYEPRNKNHGLPFDPFTAICASVMVGIKSYSIAVPDRRSLPHSRCSLARCRLRPSSPPSPRFAPVAPPIAAVATTWSRVACAQQPATPVIGFLGATSPDLNADFLRHAKP